jgi:hypothetical protein
MCIIVSRYPEKLGPEKRHSSNLEIQFPKVPERVIASVLGAVEHPVTKIPICALEEVTSHPDFHGTKRALLGYMTVSLKPGQMGDPLCRTQISPAFKDTGLSWSCYLLATMGQIKSQASVGLVAKVS